ncbi:hypothetical protein ACIRFH_23675 [Streptomyces sp. NPDC093586]|uniref:WXG100-like domain-containing protein n=1 Tax=Streptomyces sp. NPDC093586 TaxID=3366042 RepID=UPI00380D1EAC
MGYTIPDWLDEVLDFIGIKFPNVDEDDYRDMAEAMRDFAETFEGHGGDAHKVVSRILSSSEGWTVGALEKHWSHVKSGHLEKLPELARLFADACDVLADIVFGMKRKAEAELAIMAGSVGLSLGLSFMTGGLSAVLGAAEIAAMRQVAKRIIDEAVDRIVEEVLTKVTEPVNAKLEAMVEDMALDLAEGAFSLPPEEGGGDGAGGMADTVGCSSPRPAVVPAAAGPTAPRRPRGSTTSSSRTARAGSRGTAVSCTWPPRRRCREPGRHSGGARAAIRSLRRSTVCCTARSRARRRRSAG